MAPEPFRIDPAGPPQAYKTYTAAAPLHSHWRSATCAEVECEAHAHGWVTAVDVTTELGSKQAKYITGQSGRTFTREISGSLHTFTFPAGQKCFAEHKMLLEREPIFMIRNGDYRQYGRSRPMNGRDWLDDFSEHQQKLHTDREQG